MDQKPKNNNNNPGDNRKPKNILVALIITVAIVLAISFVYNAISNSQYKETTYSDFLAAKNDGKLAEVELHYDRVYYLTVEEAAKPASQQKACFTGLPNGNVMALAEELDALGVKVNQVIVEDNSGIIIVLY